MNQSRQGLLGRGGPLGVFYEYPVLLRLAGISVCAEMAWATLIIVMEYYFKDELLRGRPDQLIASRVATALLAFTVCECIFKVPMGALSDRIGPRPVILTALTMATISPLLMVLARHWVYFLPLRAIDGFAAAALWPSMSALMARAVPRQAKASAMSVFNGAYCLGIAIGPMLGLYLGHALHSNRFVFPVCSAMMFGGVVIALLVLRPAVLGNVLTAHRATHDANGEEFPSHQGLLLKGRPMLMRMMMLYALSQTSVGILATVLPLYIAKEFNIQQGDIPRLIALPALVIAFIALPLGRVADAIGRVRAIWFSYGLATFGMLLIAAVPLLPAFAFGLLCLVVVFIVGTPAWLGLTSLQVNDRRQAEALSLMQTAQGVGVVVGLGAVASAGHLMTQWQKVRAVLHHHGHATTAVVTRPVEAVPIDVWLYIAAGVFALCLIGTLLMVREPEHSPEAEESAASSKQPLEITGV
jgi:MFS family permease